MEDPELFSFSKTRRDSSKNFDGLSSAAHTRLPNKKAKNLTDKPKQEFYLYSSKDISEFISEDPAVEQ